MSTARPDPRQVYLSCSSIFKGKAARARQLGAVHAVLRRNRIAIKGLTQQFGIPNVAVVAQDLLLNNVFTSESQARARFPDLFEESRNQAAATEASEAEVETDVEEAIRSSNAAAEEEMWTTDVPAIEHSHNQELSETSIVGDSGDEKGNISAETRDDTTEASNSSPTIRLSPPYLPFKVQHQVLTRVQSILEECCFDFGNAWVPHMMKEQRWEEVESVELNQWSKYILRHTHSLPHCITRKKEDRSLEDILFSIRPLRHSAVHRIRISAPGTLKLINSAIVFADALQDKRRAASLRRFHEQVSAGVTEVNEHQARLQTRLDDELAHLARKRAELDAMEKSAIDQAWAEDEVNRRECGTAVQGFLANMESDVEHSRPEEFKEDSQDTSSKVDGRLSIDEEGTGRLPQIDEPGSGKSVDEDCTQTNMIHAIQHNHEDGTPLEDTSPESADGSNHADQETPSVQSNGGLISRWKSRFWALGQ